MKRFLRLTTLTTLLALMLGTSAIAKTIAPTSGIDGQQSGATDLSCTYPITVSGSDSSDDFVIINLNAMTCYDPNRGGAYRYDGLSNVYVYLDSLQDIQSVVNTKKIRVKLSKKTCDVSYFDGGNTRGIGECSRSRVSMITISLPKRAKPENITIPYNIYVTYSNTVPSY